MSLYQSFRLAFQSILSSKVRALLTMLGIIIGVASVIVIIGLGNGMQTRHLTESFESMGTKPHHGQCHGARYGTSMSARMTWMSW